MANQAKLLLSSFSTFIIAYVFLIINNHLFINFLAFDENINSTIFFTYIITDTPTLISSSTEDSIISLNLAAPFLSFILGLISLFIYIFASIKSYSISHILLWLIFISFNNALGEVIIGCFFNTPITQVAEIMHFGISVKIIIAGVSLFLLVRIGTLLGDSVIAKSNHTIINSKKQRFYHLLFTIIFPAIAGYLLLLLMRGSEKLLQFNLLFITLGVMIISAFFRYLLPPTIKKSSTKLHIKNIIISSITALLMLICYYIITKNGFSCF